MKFRPTFSCARQTTSLSWLVCAAVILSTAGCSPSIPLRSNDFGQLLWSVDVHPSEDGVASGGNAPSVRLSETKSGTLIDTLPVAGTVTRLRWHPEGDRLAVALQIGEESSFLWHQRTGKKTHLDSVSADGARGLAWSPDGTRLAVGDNEGMLLLYTADGALIDRQQVDPKGITDLSWHPDGNRLTTVGSGIAHFDLLTDSVRFYPARSVPVLTLSVAWHPGGEIYVTGDYGDRDNGHPPLLQTWTADGELIRQDSTSRAEFRNLEWNPDGTVLASASDGLRLWSPAGEMLGHTLAEHYLWGLAWTADGERLAVTSGEGRTFILNKNLRVLREW